MEETPEISDPGNQVDILQGISDYRPASWHQLSVAQLLPGRTTVAGMRVTVVRPSNDCYKEVGPTNRAPHVASQCGRSSSARAR
jgi:hypothetical protein